MRFSLKKLLYLMALSCYLLGMAKILSGVPYERANDPIAHDGKLVIALVFTVIAIPVTTVVVVVVQQCMRWYRGE